jgi:hypothetical protein
MKATLQRPRPSFKKPSWQGGSSMLGVRRGFVDKNYSGRVHHSDRHRHFSPERRPFSDNYPRRRNSMDFEERPVPMREYRGYYRRDSAARGLFSFSYTKITCFCHPLFLSTIISFVSLVLGTSHKYGRTHPGSRIREAYAESQYSNKYPKHRQAMHEEPMQRDPYRRSKYGHSYQERAHRISCPECDLCDDKSGAVHSYQYQNGEEFSSTSGCEQAYHKKVSTVLPLSVLYYIHLDADQSLCCYIGP